MADERQRILTICLIAALVASGHSLSAAGPGRETISAPGPKCTRIRRITLSRLLRGTSVRVTVVDGAEIEGELFSARDDKLVLSNYRKNPRRQAVLSRNTGQVTIERSDITSLRAPAWAQSAAHRDGERFLYDVVGVGFGQTPAGLRIVWTNWKRSLAIRSSGPGFWLALRITDLYRTSEAEMRRLGASFPGFLFGTGGTGHLFVYRDRRSRQRIFSSARDGRRIAGCSSWRPLD